MKGGDTFVKSKTIIIPVILMSGIALAIGFFSGIKYQESKINSQNTVQGRTGRIVGNGPGSNFQTQRMGNRSGTTLRPVSGKTIKMDDTSITVSLPDGSSKIVVVSDSTTINRTSEAKKTDIHMGDEVAVFGISNTDGSITAQNIQLNPIFKNLERTASPSSNN